MVNGSKLILEELKEIKQEIGFIREHMIDADSILDLEDKKAIEEAEKDFKEGKTKSLEQLKKEMGL